METHTQLVEVAKYSTHFTVEITIITTITTLATETHCHPLGLVQPLTANAVVDGGDGATYTIVITTTIVASKQPLNSYRVPFYIF